MPSVMILKGVKAAKIWKPRPPGLSLVGGLPIPRRITCPNSGLPHRRTIRAEFFHWSLQVANGFLMLAAGPGRLSLHQSSLHLISCAELISTGRHYSWGIGSHPVFTLSLQEAKVFHSEPTFLTW